MMSPPLGSRIQCPVAHRGSQTDKDVMTETDIGANAEEYYSTVLEKNTYNPASLVLYDNVPPVIVCARGICVLEYDRFYNPENDDNDADNGIAVSKDQSSLADWVLTLYLGPRALLNFASVLYGTTSPLGTTMNNALPTSAAMSARMVLEFLDLYPLLPKMDRSLSATLALCGCFTNLGYISQSLSLVNTSWPL